MIRIVLTEGTPAEREDLLGFIEDFGYEVRELRIDFEPGGRSHSAMLVTEEEVARPPAEED